jgi:hypothetical protein
MNAMKLLAVLPILLVASLMAEDTPASSADQNVNSKYKIESVDVSSPLQKRLSRPLREDVNSLVGMQFDPQVVTDLAERIRKELHMVVTHRVERGQQPEYVRVVFESQERRWDDDDAKVTKLAYHQRQGWTGGFEVGTDIGRNRFEFGIQSDADRLIERYAGINVGVSRTFSERVRLRFEFDTLHQQWNPATEVALLSRADVPGLYRERYSMEPAIVILLAPGLSLTTGLNFQHFQTQYPAARYEAANALVTTLRHRRRWGSSGSLGHELDAGYGLRAATRMLGSDFVYARHGFDARYSMRRGRHEVTVRGGGGTIYGRAPLYERFALGDSRTLRGWNKFDIDPLGGSRAAHGTVQYMYRWLGLFYDAGRLWDEGQSADVKQSTGFTVALSGRHAGPYVTVGFPIRSGTLTPLFMMGMIF